MWLLRYWILFRDSSHSRRAVRLTAFSENPGTLLRDRQGFPALRCGNRCTSIDLRLVAGHLLVGDVRRHAQR